MNSGEKITKEEYIKIIIAIFLIILVGLIFDSSPPLPSNCHRTPSIDVGGGEIECD